MASFAREGVNIDTLVNPIRRFLLTPAVTIPLALSLSAETLLTRLAPRLLPHFAANPSTARLLAFSARHHPYLQLAAWAAAALTLASAASGYLDRQTTNNWVRDGTYDWDREIVLVTGGASGIGAAVAQQFLRRNPRTRVVVADFSPLKWTPPAGARVSYYKIDLTDREAIEALGDKVREEVGHPTVLFNNAGIGKPTPVLHGPWQDFELTVKTNLLAQFYVTQQFLPDMVKNDHGHIVYSSSMSSIVPTPLISHYSATKAGLSALHDALQMELKYFYKAPRVRQSLGVFGFIQTPMVTQDTGNTNFFMPLMHVDTVGDELVKTVYSTYGKTVFLPGLTNYITALRGAPIWVFRLIRNHSANAFYQVSKDEYSGRAEWQPKN